MLRMLFTPRCDIFSVRQFVQKKFHDVLTGNINWQMFIFAREYRGRDSYKANACVPALEIARCASNGECIEFVLYGVEDKFREGFALCHLCADGAACEKIRILPERAMRQRLS